MKKILPLILSALILAGTVYFISKNTSLDMTLYCPFMRKEFAANFVMMAAQFLFTGIIVGTLMSIYFMSPKAEDLSAYKRRCEKLSVETDSSDTRIQALEAKIQTLEIALKNALEK